MTPDPKPRGGKKPLYADPKNKPAVLRVNPDGIPAALKVAARWVLWKLVWKANKDGTGKWDKVPMTTTGRGAKTNDPRTWSTFDDALAAYRTGRFDGIGFVLGDRFAGG
jgi:putative DNA primase/helicase